MGILNAEHLSSDELVHYGRIGAVRGIDPNAVDALEHQLTLEMETVYDEPQVRECNTALMAALETIFAYEPNQLWFPEQFKVYQEWKDE